MRISLTNSVTSEEVSYCAVRERVTFVAPQPPCTTQATLTHATHGSLISHREFKFGDFCTTGRLFQEMTSYLPLKTKILIQAETFVPDKESYYLTNANKIAQTMSNVRGSITLLVPKGQNLNKGTCYQGETCFLMGGSLADTVACFSMNLGGEECTIRAALTNPSMVGVIAHPSRAGDLYVVEGNAFSPTEDGSMPPDTPLDSTVFRFTVKPSP